MSIVKVLTFETIFVFKLQCSQPFFNGPVDSEWELLSVMIMDLWCHVPLPLYPFAALNGFRMASYFDLCEVKCYIFSNLSI